jgi:hypothetical protein
VAGPAETPVDDCGLDAATAADAMLAGAADGVVGVAVCSGPEQASKNDPRRVTTVAAVTIRIESTSSVVCLRSSSTRVSTAVMPVFVSSQHHDAHCVRETATEPSRVRSKNVLIGE